MLVKNLETGKTETMRHGPATDAVTAGTHEFVNVPEGSDVQAGGTIARTAASPIDLADARKAVTDAEKAVKAAKIAEEKTKAEADLAAARQLLVALEA